MLGKLISKERGSTILYLIDVILDFCVSTKDFKFIDVLQDIFGCGIPSDFSLKKTYFIDFLSVIAYI